MNLTNKIQEQTYVEWQARNVYLFISFSFEVFCSQVAKVLFGHREQQQIVNRHENSNIACEKRKPTDDAAISEIFNYNTREAISSSCWSVIPNNELRKSTHIIFRFPQWKIPLRFGSFECERIDRRPREESVVSLSLFVRSANLIYRFIQRLRHKSQENCCSED